MKSAKANLKGPVYRYNPHTCRYERTGISFWSALTYGTGLLFTSIVILAGLLLLHDFMYDTPAELAFRKENTALEKNTVILTRQLESVEAKLAQLNEKDQRLHNKLFASITPENETSQLNDSRAGILLANPDTFRKVMKEISLISDKLIGKSIDQNEVFINNFENTETAFNIIPSLPIYQPIEGMKPEQLLSGFGTRVNPFHKGLYEHPGIDIAVPRGTEVRSTASGVVSMTKKSDLQAGYGSYIEIDHGNGLSTRYAHMEEVKVRAGQKVEKGFIIGTSGNSGGSVAPHLHYEILRNGSHVDPILYMIDDLSTAEYESFKSASQKQNQSLD